MPMMGIALAGTACAMLHFNNIKQQQKQDGLHQVQPKISPTEGLEEIIGDEI